MAVGQAGLYFVKRSMGESIAGVLNRWEISYWWEISSMQREILSDLVQWEIVLLQYLGKEI